MTEYQIEQAAKAKTFQNQVKAIAKALGRPIVTRPGDVADRIGLIDLGEGRAIHFGKVWNQNRAEVSGVWPRNAKGELFSPRTFSNSNSGYASITISLDRSPEAVAKDITRRLLPGYNAEYAQQVLYRDGSDKHANDTVESLRLAAAALGVAAPKAAECGRTLSLSVQIGDTWGSVEACGEDVSLKLTGLSREHAAVVLAAVKSLKG